MLLTKSLLPQSGQTFLPSTIAVYYAEQAQIDSAYFNLHLTLTYTRNEE